MKRIIPILFLYLWVGTAPLYAQGNWVPFVANLAGKPPQAASFLNEKFGFVETGGTWYRTTDGGISWQTTHGLGVQGLVHLNFFYNTPQNIIVNGAFESNDSGLTWQIWGNPSHSESIYEKDSALFDADGRMSSDHALNWQQIMGYSGGEAVVGNMDQGIAMWGGQGFGITPGSTLYTTDGGYTWHIGQAGVEADYGYAIPFTLIYLRSGGDGNDEIERTSDGGATWHTVFRPFINSSWYLSDGIKGDGCVIYAQTDTTHLTPAGVLRSTDKGLSWVGIGGPMCTDDAPICGVCSRGAVCFAMDYFKNGNNTLWKYTDQTLLRSVMNDLTIDRLFPDTVFVKACDTTQIKVKLHFTACDFIRFHDLRIDSISQQNYQSFFPINGTIRTGFPDSGTIAIMPTVPGTYHLLARISIAASDWSIFDTTLPFVLVVGGHPPALIITPDDTINFGATQICVSGGQADLFLSNPSCVPLRVTQVLFNADTAGKNAYTVSMPVPDDLFRGSADGKISILYHPKSEGFKTGKIIIVTTIGNDTIPVSAIALPDTPKLTITKNTPVDFGTQTLCLAGGKDTIVLSDSSCKSLKINSILFESDSTPSSEFTVNTAVPVDLQFGKPAARCILNFKPLTSGFKTGRLIIQTSIGNDTIPVSANIVADERALTLKADSLISPICDSSEGLVMIHNLSCRQMSLDSLVLQKPFVLLPKQLPAVINSGDSIILRIRFAPSVHGIVNITSTASLQWYLPNGPIGFDTTLILSGFGLPGTSAFSFSDTAVSFDTMSLCDSEKHLLVLYSTGCDSLLFRSISLSGDPDFHLVSHGRKEIPGGDSLQFVVSLDPLSNGSKSAEIIIALNDSSNIVLPINGTITGIRKQLLGSPAGPIDFGMQKTCQNSDTIITLKNPGCDTIIITGTGFAGSGFSTNQKFPDTLLPGQIKQVDVFTVLDTSAGVQSNSSQLTFTSDANNTLAPIRLSRSYIYPHPVRLWLDADEKPLTSSNIWKAKLKGNPGDLADVQTLDLILDYNSDLLGYMPNLSSVKSADGKTFHITGSPSISTDSDSTISELAFEVYLTKDTTTTFILKNITLNSSDPNFMGCVAIPQASGIAFNYLDICGDPSIRTFMRNGSAIRITSISPNPTQDEIEINLQSSIKQDALVEIFNNLGWEVFSTTYNIGTGPNSIHLQTKDFASGMYFLRIGGASASFAKVK